MTDNSTSTPVVPEKPVFILVGLCLLALVATMVFHRITHPLLDIRKIESHTGMEQGPMGDITGLMQRLEEHPEDVDALRSLGNAFMHMKAWDRAVMFWDRVLAIRPHDAMALNQRGVCFFQKQDYEKAADTFATLLTTDPANEYALFNLGVLHKHFLGHPEKGDRYLETILEQGRASPEVMQGVRRELDTKPQGTSGE
ncbi:tetratricopeptide repeat protein [Desulfoplanes sp.]